jgi:hypothetical protein
MVYNIFHVSFKSALNITFYYSVLSVSDVIGDLLIVFYLINYNFSSFLFNNYYLCSYLYSSHYFYFIVIYDPNNPSKNKINVFNI